jgi:hypothetical protein
VTRTRGGACTARALIALGLCALMLACARQAQPALTHEAYIWQRVWTPALSNALTQQAELFSGWRVQALAVPGAGAPIAARVNLDALRRDAKPVRAVVRIEGRRLLGGGMDLIEPIVALARAWRAQGVPLAGIEIDHDCANTQLAGYAQWLARLRRALPTRDTLSITALPAWLDAPELDDVLGAVDESVLQVHMLDAEADALFDPTQAERWIRAWSARSTRGFRVSLPAYAVRAHFGADGALAGVESEVPLREPGAYARELFADPHAVARLLAALDDARPARMQGYLWFRLPLDDDVRSWRIATLRAVLTRMPLRTTWQVDWVDARDVRLRNAGAIDAVWPARIVVHGDCQAGDGVAGYQLHRKAPNWAFERLRAGWLAPGAARTIGWLNCAAGSEVRVDVEHEE